MNNEPRRGDGGSGRAIAPTGLRNVRAPYRGFASTLTARLCAIGPLRGRKATTNYRTASVASSREKNKAEPGIGNPQPGQQLRYAEDKTSRVPRTTHNLWLIAVSCGRFSARRRCRACVYRLEAASGKGKGSELVRAHPAGSRQSDKRILICDRSSRNPDGATHTKQRGAQLVPCSRFRVPPFPDGFRLFLFPATDWGRRV